MKRRKRCRTGWSRAEESEELTLSFSSSVSLITLFTKGGISTPTSTSPHSIPQALPQAKELCQSLVKLSALLIASRTDLFTYNSLCSQISAQVTSSKDDYITIEAGSKIPNLFISTKILLGNVISLGIRLPYAIPIFAVHTPAMLIGWSLSKKYASHEEESMASAKSIW